MQISVPDKLAVAQASGSEKHICAAHVCCSLKESTYACKPGGTWLSEAANVLHCAGAFRTILTRLTSQVSVRKRLSGMRPDQVKITASISS